MRNENMLALRAKALLVYQEGRTLPRTGRSARVWIGLASRYAERNGCERTAEYLRGLERTLW